MSCFYLSDGPDRFLSQSATAGPWGPASQHGGPPAALLGRAVEHCEPREDVVVARMTVEILGPVPVGDVSVRSRVLRPGRSVELVEAVLSAGGRDAARAAAWRVRRTAQDGVPARVTPAPELPTSALVGIPAGGWVDGYLSAIEWRFVDGRFDVPGPATAWSRMRHPLVAEEEVTPLTRALIVADSGNGLSSELDLTWHFINPELTVHLHREPVGDWVCVAAQTTISPGGAGLATTVLHDLEGPIGVGAQSLLVAPR